MKTVQMYAPGGSPAGIGSLIMPDGSVVAVAADGSANVPADMASIGIAISAGLSFKTAAGDFIPPART
ncbi:MAG: hypothetical protein M0015_16690 [Betaproteobacteria bacterium]|nr:hypothetical protein [Betaproteobacteria bacterium]